ncbi:MAG: hypothetical protein ACRDIC_18065 [bacterium]
MKIREILGLVLRYTLGSGVAFLSVLPVLFGGSDISNWLQVQLEDPYYGNRNYLETGLPVMLFGLGILALTGYVTVRRKISPVALRSVCALHPSGGSHSQPRAPVPSRRGTSGFAEPADKGAD